MRDFGAVAIAIASPTRVILVKDLSKTIPKLKFPVGGIEAGETVIEAAIREGWQESGGGIDGKGIRLQPSKCQIIQGEQHLDDGYYAHLVYASVTEEQFDTRGVVGDEDGSRLEVHSYPRLEIARLGRLLLPKHHVYVRMLYETVGGF